jgi:hypothetical protein
MSNNDLKWLLDDAIELYKLNRKDSSILLLLCAVDALAKYDDPNNKNNRERFEKFLTKKMRWSGRVQIHNIEVPKKKKLCSFEYIIYKFIRCPFVHEGTQLRAIDSDYDVCIDWYTIPHGIKVDQEKNKIILGGELVLKILVDVVKTSL